MDTTWSSRAGQQTQTTTNTTNNYSHQGQSDEDILVHFSEDFSGPQGDQEGRRWDGDAQSAVRRAMSRRSSKSYSARMSRQKSRKRDMFGRQSKPGITVDTSFTRHKGNEPHQVFSQDDLRSGSSIRKQNWFGVGRSSTKNKGLGITKGTPQPDRSHRANPSVDQSDMATAISLTPGDKSWQDISPWDRRIPIGIQVPTDSISDFSSFNGSRYRSGSDATLVTPNIVITPAEAMKSVWSPDTPFTASDYTTSMYSRSGLDYHSDTLDSNGTAFEEDDDHKRSHRIMSTGTVFEEDETPLRERTVEAPFAIDTSVAPTPRRSQGWWNVITTPFVMTPNTAVFPPNGRKDEAAPAVPVVPASYGVSREAPSAFVPTTGLTVADAAEHSTAQKSAPIALTASSAAINATTVIQSQSQQETSDIDRSVTSPQSAMSASPVVRTAAIGTVLMPRQVDEQPRTININIELQDRRPNGATTQANVTSAEPSVHHQHMYSAPPRSAGAMTATSRTNSPAQTLPVFAPPPSHPVKGSHFSYDQGSRSSSPSSTPDLKGQKQKKHRKVFDMKSFLTFGRRKSKQDEDGKKKKKKKGWCFWGCCCCLIFLVLLAIIIPLTVVLTKKRNDTPVNNPGTQPDSEGNSGWLNLPNYPAIPTGVSTISQPEAVEEESGCVSPTTLWSCALPKELQESIKPNKPDQPNFRIQITYDNSSSASPTTKRAANPVSAGAFIRSQLLRLRALPSPSPAAPSDADMSFLGKTTDGNVAPFEGEDTPLFITFQDPKKPASRLLKRAGPSDPTNLTSAIPPPMLDSDGTAAPANLLPLPSAQPLRLYNRGTDNEHYGFYTYFDRSIFLKQINGTNRGGNPADIDGGSSKSAANIRCTYAETRFLVQIWTRSKTSKPLLQGSSQTGPDSTKRPGTFPYPVTVTLDRHGGNPAKKNLYCYEMESDGTIRNIPDKKSFQFEDRGFGGVLVNGTQGRPTATGPIDGGTGGCKCQWQNWLN
ncbi:hypothetical protein FB567DRAFT_496434 [Paraphoma chrysanthemicola]|uniref:Glycoprotease family protein n=1 Tax=Paraphoma chrysanthemicola TaxID=798071 RepID=A0A8K0VY69_9PLEO|nr:hypothetical protein FB567DRAFT_496434 [Paraphoma chrysanthemicola]